MLKLILSYFKAMFVPVKTIVPNVEDQVFDYTRSMFGEFVPTKTIVPNVEDQVFDYTRSMFGEFVPTKTK